MSTKTLVCERWVLLQPEWLASTKQDVVTRWCPCSCSIMSGKCSSACGYNCSNLSHILKAFGSLIGSVSLKTMHDRPLMMLQVCKQWNICWKCLSLGGNRYQKLYLLCKTHLDTQIVWMILPLLCWIMFSQLIVLWAEALGRTQHYLRWKTAIDFWHCLFGIHFRRHWPSRFLGFPGTINIELTYSSSRVLGVQLLHMMTPH